MFKAGVFAERLMFRFFRRHDEPVRPDAELPAIHRPSFARRRSAQCHVYTDGQVCVDAPVLLAVNFRLIRVELRFAYNLAKYAFEPSCCRDSYRYSHRGRFSGRFCQG